MMLLRLKVYLKNVEEKKYNSYVPESTVEFRLQQARCEQDAPSLEMSETEKRMLEINAAIAAIPPRGSQRHCVLDTFTNSITLHILGWTTLQASLHCKRLLVSKTYDQQD